MYKRNKNAKGKSKAKPKGQYKSSLEAYCAAALQEAGISFEYEKHKYVLQDSFKGPGCYYKSVPKKGELVDGSNKTVLQIIYTPDFVSYEKKFVIETKGYVMSDDFPLRWKMFLRHCRENDMYDWKFFIPKNKAQVDEAIKLISDENR